MLRRFTFGAALLVMLAGGPAHSQQTMEAMGEAAGNKVLLVTIAHWLSANFDLPLVLEPRRLERVTSARLASLSQDVVAFYGDSEGTIYLPEHWTGETPAEFSILVHEMVHHIQHVGGLTYACREAREKAAFAAQDKWLQLFGSDLASAFGIDPFTLLANTNCIH